MTVWTIMPPLGHNSLDKNILQKPLFRPDIIYHYQYII
jgi:hypothetical protein